MQRLPVHWLAGLNAEPSCAQSRRRGLDPHTRVPGSSPRARGNAKLRGREAQMEELGGSPHQAGEQGGGSGPKEGSRWMGELVSQKKYFSDVGPRLCWC